MLDEETRTRCTASGHCTFPGPWCEEVDGVFFDDDDDDDCCCSWWCFSTFSGGLADGGGGVCVVSATTADVAADACCSLKSLTAATDGVEVKQAPLDEATTG